jgi:hypothetical protein
MNKIIAAISIGLFMATASEASLARQYSDAEKEIHEWAAVSPPKYASFFNERDVVLFAKDISGGNSDFISQLDKRMAAYSLMKEKTYLDEAEAAGLKQYMRPFRYIGRIGELSEISGKSATIIIVYLSNLTTKEYGNVLCAKIENRTSMLPRSRVILWAGCALKEIKSQSTYDKLIEDILWAFPTDSATLMSSP